MPRGRLEEIYVADVLPVSVNNDNGEINEPNIYFTGCVLCAHISTNIVQWHTFCVKIYVYSKVEIKLRSIDVYLPIPSDIKID